MQKQLASVDFRQSQPKFTVKLHLPRATRRRLPRPPPSWTGLTSHPAPATSHPSPPPPPTDHPKSSSCSTPQPPPPPPRPCRRRHISWNGERRWSGWLGRTGLSCSCRATVGLADINGVSISSPTSWPASPSASCSFLRYRKVIDRYFVVVLFSPFLFNFLNFL